MVQVIEQSTPWGEVAGGFGKGLGESFSDEVGKQFVSRGLGKLQEEVAGGGLNNRMQIFQRLLKIPGMDMDKVQMYMPFVEDMIQQQAAQSRGGAAVQPGQQPVMGTEEGISVEDEAPASRFDVQIPQDSNRLASLVTPREQKSFWDEEMVGSPDQLRQIAVNLQQQTPGLHPTFSGYLQEAKDLVDSHNRFIEIKRGATERRSTMTTEVTEAYDNATKAILQRKDKEDVSRDLPESIQKTIRETMIGDMETTKKSPQELASKYADKTREAVRSYKDFLKEANQPLFAQAGEKQLQNLSKYREKFEEWGALEEYQDLLQSKGFGPEMSAALAYPGSLKQKRTMAGYQKENPNLGVSIREQKAGDAEWLVLPIGTKYEKQFKKSGLSLDPTVRSQQLAERTVGLSEKLIDTIDNETSLKQMSLSIYDEGLDVEAFYDTVDKAVQDGTIKLNDRQKRELAQRLPVDATLTDLFNTASLTGTTKYGFGQIFRKLSRGGR